VTIINDDQAAQLKAEAIAARRAARAAWQNFHVDRINREREARETAREYRQRTKQCSSCSKSLPLDCFSPAFQDRPTARCKPCVAAATRERYHRNLDRARSRTRNRPAYVKRPRQTDEQRERRAAERQHKTEERKRQQTERQCRAAQRVAQLTALLMGTSPGQRITSEREWDVATTELRRLWVDSGEKECAACKAVVPPSAMHPPGPANFYPGKCRSCAREEYRENQLRVFGRVSQGPPKILLRDGTSITIGEFARRHTLRRNSG
jgi:hypothetical protein